MTISLGDMHLDALKKVGREVAALHEEDRMRTIDHEDVTDEQ